MSIETLARPADIRQRVFDWRRQGLRIALVPTMGNLHEGHATLVNHARKYADRVIVSIFVNPLQFGPSEDFARYPRTPVEDRALLEQYKADLLFAPEVQDICTRYGIPYNKGPLPKQFASVVRKIVKLALPS